MVDYLCLCLEDFFTIDDGGNEVGLAYLLNVVVQEIAVEDGHVRNRHQGQSMASQMLKPLKSRIISYFESPATVWLVRAAHPDRHRLSHALLESETESAVALVTAIVSQLLGGEVTLGCYSLTIKADKMIDAQIVDICIVANTLTGEILTEIETVNTNSLSQLRNSQIVL